MQKIKWDYIYSVILICLIGMGISYSFSASSILALDAFGDIDFFLKKQVVNFTLGVVAMIVVAKYPYQKMRKFIPVLNFATIVLMFLPMLPGFGVSINGAERWVNLFGFSFQPSEIAKITIIVTLAHMIDVRKRLGVLNSLSRGFAPIAFYLGMYGIILILVQKHLSATGLIVLVSAVMLLIGGLSIRYFLIFGSLGAGAAVFAVILEPFRMARIFGFMNPEEDPMGKGYHVLQSWYALGSGEIFGLGLGMSRQKFTWLPENHTDFIMAIIGEETGLVGVTLIISLFALLVIRGIIISSAAPDTFGLMIGSGITMLIFFQSIINMMVVSGLFPVTGVPLPLISYGGTSTIILMMGIGLIYNISSQTNKID